MHRFRPFIWIFWETKSLMQYNINTCIIDICIFHPLMHIITYKNGMSKILKSKTAIRLKHFVFGRTHICLLAIVNVTYVTHCYAIKSRTVVKS